MPDDVDVRDLQRAAFEGDLAALAELLGMGTTPGAVTPEDLFPPDDPRWRVGLRSLAMWGLWQIQDENFDPAQWAWQQSILSAFEQSDPEQYATVLTALDPELRESGEGVLGDDILSTLMDYLNAPESRSTDEVINEFRTERVTGETVTRERRTRYIDLPTSEGFLASAERMVDAFTNSFLGYLSELRAGGQITEVQQRWAIENIHTEFYPAYRAELAKRAQAGELKFEVAGVTGEQQKIGLRPGEMFSQAIETRVNELTETLRTGTVTGVSAKGEVTTPISEQQRQQITQQIESMRNWQNEFIQTEELRTRPQLEVTVGYTPTEFLEERGETWLKQRVAVGRPTTVSRGVGAVGAGGRPRRI